MTRETVEFLLSLLDRINLSGADPDLLDNAQRIQTARAELDAALRG